MIPSLKGFGAADCVLYVYGYLKYFDFAKKERLLRFCYRYLPQGSKMESPEKGVELLAQWVMAGPPNYNTHT